MEIEEKIPAFPMWKMFNETTPALFNTETPEAILPKLLKLVKSKEFTTVFVYNVDSTISYENRIEVTCYYKAFTVWLLGKFFYLLSNEKFNRLHKEIRDVQLRILQQISIYQPTLYEDLTLRYINSLKDLNNFKNKKLTLNYFTPEPPDDLKSKLNLSPLHVEINNQTCCDNLQLQLLKLVSEILKQNLDLYLYNESSYECVNCFCFVLHQCNIELKINCLENCFYRLINLTDLPQRLFERLQTILMYFEAFIYDIYNQQIVLSTQQLNRIEKILVKFFKTYKQLNAIETVQRIALFLHSNTHREISLELKKQLMEILSEDKKFEISVKDLSLDLAIVLPIVKQKLAVESKNATSDVKTSFLGKLEQLIAKKCEGKCVLSDNLTILRETIRMTLISELNDCILLNVTNDIIAIVFNYISKHLCPFTAVNVDKSLEILSWSNGNMLKVSLDVFDELLIDNPKTTYRFLSKWKTVDNSGALHFSNFIRYHWQDFNAEQKERIWHIFQQTICLNRKFTHLALELLPFFANLPNYKTKCVELYIRKLPDEPNIALNILSNLLHTLHTQCTFKNTWNLNTDKIDVELIGLCQDCSKTKNFIDEKFIQLIYKTIEDHPNVKLQFVKSLPVFATYVTVFRTQRIADKWLKLLDDSDDVIREEMALVLSDVIRVIWMSETGPKPFSNELLTLTFSKLKISSKKSLQTSNYKQQINIIHTLDQLSLLGLKPALLPLAQLFIYFIMIPTSKYSLIAVNFFTNLAKNYQQTTKSLFCQYKHELCETIAELSAINQMLINYKLLLSLEAISLVLGFYGPKDFVTQCCRHFLPHLIPLAVQMPRVEELIVEVGEFIGMGVSELFTNRYACIFLHVYLKEDESFREIISYVEKRAGLSGRVLRRNNFALIVDELLLNFHEKRDRVLQALRILAKEDTPTQLLSIQQIPDYLQLRFLGVLAYFDLKLRSRYSATKRILLSLTELLKFMGRKHVTPVRFKILAILRNALTFEDDNLLELKQLNGDIWDAFVRTCDIEILAPQLASIFFSILPLNEYCFDKINEIFSYLIIENEEYTKEHITDLFFVTNDNLSPAVQSKIKKYLDELKSKSFKQQIQVFLKYLTYETVEIRVHALKQLKQLLAVNREELDLMILGYNGIDPVIVELLDLLTLGCREKEETIRLACGECIGELGAIEPTHLPQRYTPVRKSFVFYLTEDAFILNSLSELSRAFFQAEKNTQNMDRFALAIQEILKQYGISPESTSAKNHLWLSLPDAQKQLMLPLLSSRYTMVQSINNVEVHPVFTSNLGTSFQSWIFNWTCSLITTLNVDKRNLLQVCLPSFNQDQRTLMHFLPHILLHALLEGGANVQDRIIEEFNVVMSSFDTKCQLSEDIQNVRPLVSEGGANTTDTPSDEHSRRTLSAKVIFVLLDFLDRWIREFRWKGSKQEKDSYSIIRRFVEKFSKLQIAKCNYQCGEYPRALLYLEEYISEAPENLSQQLGFLAKLYFQLNESDGVAGVTALEQSEPTFEQRILSLEVSGKLADATACYERINHPLKPHHLQGLVQCYLNLDNINTALNLAQGAIDRQKEYSSVLLEIQAEPLWRLGRYDELDTLLKTPELKKNDSWGVQIGRVLLHMRNRNREQFVNTLKALKMQEVNYLGAASMEEGAYQRGYSHITRLHILNELEQVENVIQQIADGKDSTNVIKKLCTEWELRLKVVQESLRVREPILCMRRVALEQTINLMHKNKKNSIPHLKSLVGDMWLLSAKTARAAGVHQQAYSYTLKSEEYAPPTLFLEKAKLHWLREEHNHALTTLKRGLELLQIDDTLTGTSDTSNTKERLIVAKAKLLIAVYNDTISNVDSQVNIQNYKDAVSAYREWEKSLVFLAQYYDRVFTNIKDEEKDITVGKEIQICIIMYFGKSLQYGTNYVHQSMPRLLSIWFDCGTRLFESRKDHLRKDKENALISTTKLIDDYSNRLPLFVFLTAFSQLVSRICHPQKEVYGELKCIIIKLLLQYPQHSLWMIISVIKSSYLIRSQRCADILKDPQLERMSKLLGDFTKLAEKLIQLCNIQLPDNLRTASVNKLIRTLPRLLTRDDFSEIMIPTQKFRKLVLPNPDFTNTQHNPFPNHYVHIHGIEDEIVVMTSLQKPRRITFRGSDGNLYPQLLKSKDDLRKDFRLMEFNDIVNHLLAKEPESRQRRLSIRLYSVVPLNEDCGLIEWIPDLLGLRPILLNLYKQRGVGMGVRELQPLCDNLREPLAKKRETFNNILLVRHPPILGEWFRFTFPDPQGWLSARTAYIRTTAAISMVGYILGLGDRHGENILLDSTNGDTVHVDYSCLFNKGESLEWPERVPFRLTHNMIAAMGPLGIEGTFRNSCESTLRVLRAHAATLMSVVRPFVYDPLVEKPKYRDGGTATTSAQNAEVIDEKAMEQIKNIELRLQGMLRKRGKALSIALSVEGQTNYLIQEAMSIDNLCQMYVGWGAFM